MTIRREQLAEPTDRDGYQIRHERWFTGLDDDGTEMHEAYTTDGLYIGDEKTAKFLVEERGIAPQLNHPDHTVCSIGFAESTQQWFGWSHRGICGFAPGDTIAAGDIIHGENPERFPAGYVIADMSDAEAAARVYAEAVS